MYLIFDTETTGLPKNWNAPVSDLDNWPRLVQLAWQTHDETGKLLAAKNYIIKPEGFTIPFNSEKVHGISTQRAQDEGHDLTEALKEFAEDIGASEYLIAHNISFDLNIMGAEFLRKEVENDMWETKQVCTMKGSTNYCQLPGRGKRKFKPPKLEELHRKLFGEDFDEAHNAAADVEATARCFFGVLLEGVLDISSEKVDPGICDALKSYTEAIVDPTKGEQKDQDETAKEKPQTPPVPEDTSNIEAPFSHLHAHSQFSVLQATAQVDDLIDKAKEYNMPAVAMTDHGNMYGVFNFVRAAHQKGIKPIIGSELYVTKDRHKKKYTKEEPDIRYQQVFLAKNKAGYHNLAKLNSLGFTEGYYRIYPRVDREIIQQYSEGLIALSGGLSGEVPDLILNRGDHQAEEAFKWWVDTFGENFYVELQRHGLEEEKRVNEVLLGFAEKYNVKVIAANNTYYIDKKDSEAHDILLCIQKGELKSTPIGRGRGFRYGFPNDEYYFKSQEEMKNLFSDIPEAIENINGIVEQVESFELERDVLLPTYPIPEQFNNEDEYLAHLSYEGAKNRYGEISEEIKERLDFELEVIKKTGYPGYFLIVQDFTSKARELNVSVGPGRGSAAGSVVAYCIGITNVDPIHYNLLFERFLNPDRVSLPDIDIDFDDEGRGKIIDYVVNEYGHDQVAQIITYGTMAAKSAIRDVGRVLDLPLPDTDRIAKLVPDGSSLSKLLNKSVDELKEKHNSDDIVKIQELRKLAKEDDLTAQVIQQGEVVEGSLRNTGVHACGIIITPDTIQKYIPVCTSKDSDLLLTQFDNHVVEDAGMLKMDFLGLKTLTIINETIKMVKERHGTEIDPDTIPLDDKKTYQLYQRGLTNGTFQFESQGMQKNLRALKPNRFEDLIAMNALYRPGPMEYIPNFIRRKTGDEAISYDLPEMEEYLEETYGITVYQEQVMLLSQKLAGFTKGQADSLRKAMGKKIQKMMDELKPKFFEGCKENGHDEKVAEKIWNDWEAFASYAFNKSHATCYSFVAFQTGYLKANYTAEYMASVLTHNMNDIKKVSFFMEECRRIGVPVLGPDVNESKYKFVVNDNSEIRFGLGALKGVGEGAVEALVKEREANGPYESVFDVVRRTDLKAVNKKSFESLVLAGAFDDVSNIDRSKYFMENNKGERFLERIFRYGTSHQENKNAPQGSLFGDDGGGEFDMPEPDPPEGEDWNTMEKLSREKEVVGVYISGHPLDDHKISIEHFCNADLKLVKEPPKEAKGKEAKVAGIVISAAHRTSKKGNQFAILEVEDYKDTHEFFVFSETYLKYKHLMVEGTALFITGKFGPAYRDKEALEMKVDDLCLLSEVPDKYPQCLTLEMELDDLTDDLIRDLSEVLESSKGKSKVRFSVKDGNEKLKVDLKAPEQLSVSITRSLVDGLERIGGLNYQLKRLEQ